MIELNVERAGFDDSIFLGAFQVIKSTEKQNVNVVRIGKRFMLIEIYRNCKHHYELYWFIYDQVCVETERRDELFRKGLNVIIKIFSFASFNFAEDYLNLCLKYDEIDLSYYYKVDFNLEGFMKAHPDVGNNTLKFMLI